MLDSFILVLLIFSIISPTLARGLVEGPVWFIDLGASLVFIVSAVSCITMIIIYANNSIPFNTMEFIVLSFMGFVSYLRLKKGGKK